MAGIIIDRFGIWNFYARSKIKGLIFEDALRNGALKSKATNQNNAYIYIYNVIYMQLEKNWTNWNMYTSIKNKNIWKKRESSV